MFEMCDLGSLGFPLLQVCPENIPGIGICGGSVFLLLNLQHFYHHTGPLQMLLFGCRGRGGKNLHVISIELCQLLHHC